MIKQIIDILVKQCNFNDYVNGSVTFYEWFVGNQDLIPENLYIDYGETRFVIIDFNHLDIVYKADKIAGSGYCNAECENYRQAAADNLEEFFAKIEFAYEYCGIRFYAEEVVSEQKYFLNKSNAEMLKAIKKYMPPVKYDKLLQFIKDRGINDLHSRNWGLNKENNLVILDYAGFEVD